MQRVIRRKLKYIVEKINKTASKSLKGTEKRWWKRGKHWSVCVWGHAAAALFSPRPIKAHICHRPGPVSCSWRVPVTETVSPLASSRPSPPPHIRHIFSSRSSSCLFLRVSKRLCSHRRPVPRIPRLFLQLLFYHTSLPAPLKASGTV